VLASFTPITTVTLEMMIRADGNNFPVDASWRAVAC